jgi:short-subunit dehydrogenase
MRIKGSVVVVTGASSGIGRATALALAGLHARLVLVARDVESLAQAAAECATAGAEVLVVAADVADPEAVEDVACLAVEASGASTPG